MTAKLGSLFDGSGGFPLSACVFGGRPVWASEIEPYPIAVTRERLPGMKHLGDISKINGAEIEPVDIITFGSPCQDLSVAGKRAGLKHESNGDEETTRSGLFMESVRIIKEMREATNGLYPRFAFWENVPGAFSSQRGEDLRIVLEELCKIAEPAAVMPPVPDKGWAYADSYTGDGWSLAYRVFDAQYWGVPQRRRRIHLIVDFRGECARKILFEREGLRGYFEEGRTPWQGVACNVETCTGFYDFERNGRDPKGISNDYKRPVTFEPGIAAREGGHIYEGVSGTIRANAGDNRMAVAHVAYSVENHPADSRVNIDESGKVQTLTSRMGTGGGNVPMIMEQKPVYCLPGSMIGRADKNGPQGDGVNENVAFTCNTIDRHAVVIACSAKQQSLAVSEDRANTLGANDYKEPQVIALDRASFNQGQNAKYDFEISESGINSTLTARGPSAVAYVDTTHADDVVRIDDTVAPLQARDFKGGKLVCQSYGIGNGQVNQSITEEQVGTLSCMNDQQAVLQTKPQYIVRRLTPTECARLQGFPDWWGHISEKADMTDEEYRFWLEVRKTYDRIQADAAIEAAKRAIEAEEAKNHPDPGTIKKQQDIIDRAELRKEKEYTKKQMLTWYNKLHTDSAEYKMWGNGIALPPALYCMQGIMEVLNAEKAQEETTEEPVNEITEETTEETTEAESPLHDRNDSIDSRNYAFIALQALNTDTPEEEQRDPALPEDDNIMEEKEDELMDPTTIHAPEYRRVIEPPTPQAEDFNALEHLYRLKDKQEKLGQILHKEQFADDVRALEYAITVLEAVGL